MEQDIFSLLYPSGYIAKEEDGFTDFSFIKNLGIDSMIFLKRESYLGIPNLELKDYFTKNEEVLSYRIDVVEDIMREPKVYDMLVKIQPMIQNIYDMRKINKPDATVESNLYAMRTLEMYVEIMDYMKEILEQVTLHSEGMNKLKEVVFSHVHAEEYETLKKEMAKLQTNVSHIKSITVGINIDGTLRAKDAGIVSINTKEYHQGNIMDKLLHPMKKDEYQCMTELSAVQRVLDKNEQVSLNIALESAFQHIFAKSIKSFEPLIQKYFAHRTDFLVRILNDIRFLTAAVKFLKEMEEKNLPMCKPQIKPMKEQACEVVGAYNPMVALKLSEVTVVGNDFSFDENGKIFIITGPNHGGKSVFAYSIGMVQALFQLGLFVPAKEAVLSPVSNIFTHFPDSDENNYGKGRLESECARLSHILEQITEDDLIIMDEAFSSTSGTEAGYIAGEVLTGLGIIGCRGLFVTHIHDLPHQVDTFNSHPQNKSKIDNLAAQMKSKEDGTRSYKLVRTMPDGLSYAKDIAKKYGLELEQIIKRNGEN